MQAKPSLKNTAETAILSPVELFSKFKTSAQGLAEDQVQTRRQQDGANEITTETDSTMRLIWRQFRSPMVLLLVAACIISVLVGESVDAITIAVIILINAVLGFA
mgnify:CR=1 FL=1